MTCLLCPSPAVADALCVDCGAKVAVANLWRTSPEYAANRRARLLRQGELESGREYWPALRVIDTPEVAHAFLAEYEQAKASGG